MAGARIQAKVNKGYAKAAAHLGFSYEIYRPDSSTDPLNLANRVTAILASFDPMQYKFTRPNKYGEAPLNVLLDPSFVKIGDYLVGDQRPQTVFIASMQPLLPITAIECNHTVTISRPANLTQVGVLGYNAGTVGDGDVLATSWPASILTKSRGEGGDTRLPRDTRLPWSEILLPPIPGVDLQFDDILTDENGRRHEISSAESSGMGWRILAVLLAT